MEYKSTYIFPAIFSYADDGITIEFPDLPGAISYGENEEEALLNAKECLELHLYGMEEDSEAIPQHEPIKNIKLEENQTIIMVKVFMKLVRDEMKNKAVKKTLTIPKWLNDAAKEHHLNFSAILKNALMEQLGIE